MLAASGVASSVPPEANTSLIGTISFGTWVVAVLVFGLVPTIQYGYVVPW